MWQLITNLNNIWSAYPIEFIVLILTTLYGLLRLLNDSLPIKYKLDKRFNFLKNVKSTLFSITVSISCNSLIEPDKMIKKFNSFWNENTRVVNQDNGVLVFKSLITGASYTIQVSDSDDETKSIITIENLNGFSINKLGIIKQFNKSLEELQSVVNVFSKEKDSTEKIVSQIKLTPIKKLETKKRNKVEKIIRFESTHYSYSCTLKNIKVVNKGIPKLKESIYSAFFCWIKEYV